MPGASSEARSIGSTRDTNEEASLAPRSTFASLPIRISAHTPQSARPVGVNATREAPPVLDRLELSQHLPLNADSTATCPSAPTQSTCPCPTSGKERSAIRKYVAKRFIGWRSIPMANYPIFWQILNAQVKPAALADHLSPTVFGPSSSGRTWKSAAGESGVKEERPRRSVLDAAARCAMERTRWRRAEVGSTVARLPRLPDRFPSLRGQLRTSEVLLYGLLSLAKNIPT